MEPAVADDVRDRIAELERAVTHLRATVAGLAVQEKSQRERLVAVEGAVTAWAQELSALQDRLSGELDRIDRESQESRIFVERLRRAWPLRFARAARRALGRFRM